MLLLLLSVGLGLAWTLQEQSQVPVQQDFHPEQVMLRGVWIGQGVTPCLQLFFQVSIALQCLDSYSQQRDQRSGILLEAMSMGTLCQVS